MDGIFMLLRLVSSSMGHERMWLLLLTTVIHQSSSLRPSSPEISGISPLYGPISGGTDVTITGSLPSDVTVMIYKLSCTLRSRTSISVIVTTPPGVFYEIRTQYVAAYKTYIDTPEPIILSGTGGDLYRTNYTFTYRADPELLDIRPYGIILQGGTRLTIIGDNLDSVSTTGLLLDKYLDYIHTYRFYGPCNLHNSSWMICTMPDISDNPNNLLTPVAPSVTTTQLLGPEVTPPQVSRSEKNPLVTVSVGLIFDGLPHYRNLSIIRYEGPAGPDEPPGPAGTPGPRCPIGKICSSHPDNLRPRFKTFFIMQPPTLSGSVNDIYSFRPTETINIKGRRVNTIHADNYVVYVEDAVCDILAITDTLLLCLPPQHRPGGTWMPSSHPIVVSIGTNIRLLVGQLHYPGSRYINIGFGCGVGVIILIIILVTWCICCCPRNKTTKEPERKRSLRDIAVAPHGGDKLIHLPPVTIEFDDVPDDLSDNQSTYI